MHLRLCIRRRIQFAPNAIKCLRLKILLVVPLYRTRNRAWVRRAFTQPKSVLPIKQAEFNKTGDQGLESSREGYTRLDGRLLGGTINTQVCNFRQQGVFKPQLLKYG